MSYIDVYQAQFVAKRASSVGDFKLNEGGRVLLPAMVLEDISSLSMVYPLQFKIQAHRQKPMFAGVLEFSAEIGTIVLPDWMHDQLKLASNAIVRVQTCNLGPGNLLRLQPHESAFVMLQDPRRVLEQRLVNYPVLTNGATIVIDYAQRSFKIDVVDILSAAGKSLEAVLTARADSQATELNVDFERPLDAPPSPVNKEAERTAASPTGSNIIGGSGGAGIQFSPFAFKPPSITDGPDATGESAPSAERPPEEPAFVPFAGAGRSLGGQPATATATAAQPPSDEELQKIREKRLQTFARRTNPPQ